MISYIKKYGLVVIKGYEHNTEMTLVMINFGFNEVMSLKILEPSWDIKHPQFV